MVMREEGLNEGVDLAEALTGSGGGGCGDRRKLNETAGK